jgi:hypothetical protein
MEDTSEMTDTDIGTVGTGEAFYTDTESTDEMSDTAIGDMSDVSSGQVVGSTDKVSETDSRRYR